MANFRQKLKTAAVRFRLVVATKIWANKVKKELQKRHAHDQRQFGHVEDLIERTDEMNRDAWASANEIRKDVDKTTGSDEWRRRKK
ncbi:hypothetical protein HQ571_02495 [Candidatus Kuenenbacteria bacterium]|nr:hypothetical protein [Candidatus Kuenenbacteria bacterium]